MVRFDLLLKGGHVIDPASGLDKQADLAVRAGRIASIDENIPADSAA